MRRRLWIVPLVGILLLVGVHFAVWHYAAGQLDDGFDAWLAQRRAEGWTVNTGAPIRGGWPLAAALSVPDLALRGGDASIPGGLTWRVGTLSLRVDLLSPGVLQVRAEGTQHLRVADLPEIDFTADSMSAQLPLEADTPPQAISLTARTLRAGLSGADAAAGLTVGLLQVDAAIKPAAPSGEAALTFRVSTEAIALPAGRSWALGSHISSLSIEGMADGPVPAGRDPSARAAAWRDGGGTLQIMHVALGWGPLGLSGGATLALDARLQPMGTGTVRLVGFAAALDALASGRVLTPGAATAAKAVLSLLADSPAEGAPPEVDVPLTLQDRTLAMRQVPLMKLPEVIWPTR